MSTPKVIRFNGAVYRLANASTIVIKTAKWEQHDIKQAAEDLNQRYFGGELKLNFPFVYGALRRSFAKVYGRVYFDLGTILLEKLVVSNLYNMDADLFLRILCHELIHVKLIQQQNVVRDVGGRDRYHGTNFLREVARIRQLGMDVPLSEDVPRTVEMDVGKPFREPVYGIIHGGNSATWFRHYDRQLLINVVHYLQIKYPNKKIEFVTTTNPVIRYFPIQQRLRPNLTIKPFRTTEHYEQLKPDITFTVEPPVVAKEESKQVRQDHDQVSI